MMVNTGTRLAAVNIAFSSSRNAGLFQRKLLQYTTLSEKLHHCTLSEIKTQIFTLPDVFACVSIHRADHKQHSKPDFLAKSLIIRCKRVLTLQLSTCRRAIQAQA